MLEIFLTPSMEDILKGATDVANPWIAEAFKPIWIAIALLIFGTFFFFVRKFINQKLNLGSSNNKMSNAWKTETTEVMDKRSGQFVTSVLKQRSFRDERDHYKWNLK